MKSINKAAALLGRRGGKVKTKKKAVAVRENGKKGGRPRLVKEEFRCSCCNKMAEKGVFKHWQDNDDTTVKICLKCRDRMKKRGEKFVYEGKFNRSLWNASEEMQSRIDRLTGLIELKTKKQK